MRYRLRHALTAKTVQRPEQHTIEFPFCSVIEQRSELLSPVCTLPTAFMLDILVRNHMARIDAPSPKLAKLVLRVLTSSKASLVGGSVDGL